MAKNVVVQWMYGKTSDIDEWEEEWRSTGGFCYLKMGSEQVRMRDQAKKVGKKLNYRLVNFELLLKRRCARRFLSARMNWSALGVEGVRAGGFEAVLCVNTVGGKRKASGSSAGWLKARIDEKVARFCCLMRARSAANRFSSWSML